MHSATFTRISAARLLQLIACLGILALAGCQPNEPVSGQVFLVMPDGESLRLGSVRLEMYEAPVIRTHLVDREKELADRRLELQEQLEKLVEAERQTMEAHQAAEEKYRKREFEIRTELTAYVEQLEARKATIERKIKSNVAFIDSVDRLPPAPAGIPSPAEFQAYDERRRKWLSMDRQERVAWGAVLQSMNEELEAEITKMVAERDQKIYGMADELQALDEAIITLSEAKQTTTAQVGELRETLTRFPDYTDFMKGLPTPVARSRSDADGDFVFQLPRGKTYVLFAETERRIGGEMKRFQWLVETAPVAGGTRILLSNHNLITSDAPENLIALPTWEAPSET